MPATTQTVTHWAGDSAEIAIMVKDKAGAAVDLTGATARWWLGKNVKATGTDVYVKKSTDPDGGIEIIQASPSDIAVVKVIIKKGDTEGMKAGTYYHEAEVVIDDLVSTVMTGPFIVVATMIPDDLES